MIQPIKDTETNTTLQSVPHHKQMNQRLEIGDSLHRTQKENWWFAEMCSLTEKPIKNIKFDDPFRKGKRIMMKVHQTVNCEIEAEFVKQNCECYWFDKRKMWAKPYTNPKIWGKRTQTKLEIKGISKIRNESKEQAERKNTIRTKSNQQSNRNWEKWWTYEP